MSKVRIRWITVLSFVLLAVLLLGTVLAIPGGSRAGAIDYAPTTVFTQGTGGDVGASEASGEETSYVKFSFRDGGEVYFRRDLALKWYEGVKTEDEGEGEEDAPTGTAEGPASPFNTRYLTMTFAFAPATYSTREEGGTSYKVCPQCGKNDLAETAETCSECGFSFQSVILFDRYELLFESAEENITKAAKATNSVVFKSQEDGTVKVGIKNAEAHAAEEDEKDTETEETEDLSYLTETIAAENLAKDIKLSIDDTSCDPGEFNVNLTVGEAEPVALGKFTNVGGNYLEYRSSASSTPSMPITFKATLPAAEEGRTAPNQQVLMKELNGQTFGLTDGRVVDNEPAALVLNEAIYNFTLGQRFNVSYEAIDVCDDTVTPVRSFYMLRKEKAEEGTEEPAPDAWHIPTDDDYKSLSSTDYFMPQDDSAADKAYVSIRFILRDGRFSTDSEYEYVYLTWYAAKEEDGSVKSGVVETVENGEDKLDVIVVDRVADRTAPTGPYYIGLTANDGTTSNDADPALTEAVDAYRKRLEELAADEKTSAGNGAYFYLPSLRGLIASDYADYRNLRFNIYYKKENSSTSASQETSLRYNGLRFEIDLEGRYAFKIMASDAAGNTMKYYVDEELTEVTSSNIWDIDEIPTFTFDVEYKGAEIEKPGTQDPASRGSEYSISSFEIIDLGDSIKEYSLYYFDTSKLADAADVPTYSQLVEDVEKYMGEDYAACRNEIAKYNPDIAEDDDAWEDTDNDHHWDPDNSLSFVPQNSGYYIVQLTYYDLHNIVDGKPKQDVGYQVIEVRNPYDYIPTSTNWLANNVTSVVLFCISGVLAIAIVVLFVVKPSDKKVAEVDLDKLKGGKKK